jgi:ribose 5-phosphate isomerase B
VKIALAGDHAGWRLRQAIASDLRERSHDVLDLGAHDETPSDYPDFADRVGRTLRDGQAERGILVCGSGVGVSVAANKLPGVRAGLCHDHYSAHQGVQHDDMNVLCLGARIIGDAVALEIVQAFLQARFTGEERHVRRLDKVKALEDRYRQGA